MPKSRTLIILVLSIVGGLIAVKAFNLATRDRPAPKAAVTAPVEKAPPPPPKTYSDSVPKGRRIVSIKVDEVSGATRALEKGDRVDVIAVADAAGSARGKIARVVLQNVTVHDVEQSSFKKHITDQVARKKATWTLQLLVSLPQAVTLASVDEAASLRLVLRNPEDHAVEAAQTIFYSPRTGPGPAGEGKKDIPGKIRPGMRAVSLAVDNSDGLCNDLSPGDRVDILVSFRTGIVVSNEGQQAEGSSATYTDNRKASRIFLQDIEVLSMDPAQTIYTEIPAPVTRVTLMMTPKQAEKITVISDASKSSRIRLALRHPEDHRKIATRGEVFQDQMIRDKRPFTVIYTVKGTKITPGKFYE